MSDTIAIIDADSIIYTVAYVEPSPAKAQKALMRDIENIIKDLEVDEAVVFIKGENNFRYEVDLEYKGNRVNTMDPEIKERVNRLYEYAREVFTTSDGGEADDYCFVYAMEAVKEGKTPIICHIDKDLNMIPGLHYNFKKRLSYFVEPEDAHLFLMCQTLTGDSADNIKGINRFGPATANKTLHGLPNNQLLDKVLDTWKLKCPDDWESRFYKCANCILIRNRHETMRVLSWNELIEELKWEGEDERITDPADITEIGRKARMFIGDEHASQLVQHEWDKKNDNKKRTLE
jgi:hypothetical protein